MTRDKQWILEDESVPKKVKTRPSPEQIMATSFWHSNGMTIRHMKLVFFSFGAFEHSCCFDLSYTNNEKALIFIIKKGPSNDSELRTSAQITQLL